MIPALLHAECVDARSGSHAEVVAQSPRQLAANIGHCACACAFTSSLAIVHASIAGEWREKRP
jgi:hypothetical protein